MTSYDLQSTTQKTEDLIQVLRNDKQLSL